jgi:hypothetical protein
MKINIMKKAVLAAVFSVLCGAAFAGVVLQADLYVMPPWAAGGQTVTVQMWVTNTGDATAMSVFPAGMPVEAWPYPPYLYDSDFTGPQPGSPQILTAGATAGFTWTFTMLSSGPTSDWVFTCSAQGVQLTPPATVVSNICASAPIPTDTPVYTATATITVPCCFSPTNTPWATYTQTLATVLASPTRTFTVIWTPTVCCTVSLPDLVITGLSNITMDDPVPGCVPNGGPYPPLGIHVYYQNTGTGDAGPFVISIDGVTGTAAALPAGQTANIWIPGGFAAGSVTATIDYYGTVAESDESNNIYTQVVAIPTPPINCTVTNTPTCACTGFISPTRTYTVTWTQTTGIPVTPIPSATSTATATVDTGANTPNAAAAHISAGSVINPAKGDAATITYDLDKSSDVKIIVYNRNGRLIKTLVAEKKDAARYTTTWNGCFADGSKVGSGIYIVYVKIGDYVKKLKVAVRK